MISGSIMMLLFSSYWHFHSWIWKNVETGFTPEWAFKCKLQKQFNQEYLWNDASVTGPFWVVGVVVGGGGGGVGVGAVGAVLGWGRCGRCWGGGGGGGVGVGAVGGGGEKIKT